MGISMDELSGGGGKAWGGEGYGVGDKITGKIVEAERVQQTSFDTGEPLSWPDGKPRMMSKVTIETDLREGDEDDGVRTLWLKGGSYEPKEGSGAAGEVALFEAMKAANATDIAPGGTIKAAITGLAKPTQRGLQSAKLWSIKYEPPVKSIAADDLWDE